MKILLISPTSSGIGGIAQHVQGLTKFLKKYNNEVEIISSDNTFTIPIKGLKNPSFMISSFLKTKFKKNQDIVHAHNIPAALAMKNTQGKKIESIHNNIHYLGSMNHQQTISLIRGSDVLIQPSFSEGISTTILESMACKTVIVASNVGGNLELIQDQESGILVEPTNYEMFCEKIIELMSDESLRNKLSTISYENVKKYDWENIGKQYLEVYNSLL